MSATTGECNSNFNGYQSNLMEALVCSLSDQTLLKSDGNISNISSENEHSSMNSNSSVIDDSTWIQDDIDYNSTDTQKELIMLLSADSDDDYERARKVIELDIGVRLIYHGKFVCVRNEFVPSILTQDIGSVCFLDNNYIGKGQYGTVYRGIMEYGEDRAIEVAIKTLNQCPTKNDFKDFQREISVMKVCSGLCSPSPRLRSIHNITL